MVQYIYFYREKVDLYHAAALSDLSVVNPDSPASFSESWQTPPPTLLMRKAEYIALLRSKAICDSISTLSGNYSKITRFHQLPFVIHCLRVS